MDTITLILVIIVGYLLLGLIAYKIQERFIFKPERLPANFQYQYAFPFEELNFPIKEGVTINGLLFPVAPEKRKGVVMYFHGNSRSIKGWGKFSTDFTEKGFDVVMLDYRGFGKSTGKRSEKGMKTDFQKVYEQMLQRYPEEEMIVYGRSIGSGFAAKLASTNKPQMLILESPYYSFHRLTQRILPILPMSMVLRFRLRTHVWLRYVHCPIRIIHGTKDLLIRPKASKDLAKIRPMQTVLYLIKGGGHNNLQKFPEYHETLKLILSEGAELVNHAKQNPLNHELQKFL